MFDCLKPRLFLESKSKPKIKSILKPKNRGKHIYKPNFFFQSPYTSPNIAYFNAHVTFLT